MALQEAEIYRMQETVENVARDWGLDFFPIQYELVDWEMMSQLAALGGFPVRYPHWRFGMEYYKMHRSYGYGLHRIFEMVINTAPSIAYLLRSNEPVDHKSVMAHVCGHVHYFKHNVWFANTNRDMLNEMASHASRISHYIERYGLEKVEQFIDWCLSLDNLIDMHSLGISRRTTWKEDKSEEPEVTRFTTRSYLDPFINPQGVLRKEQKKKKDEQEKAKKRFPLEPEADILLFLLENANLEAWQADVLGIVREEMYYFVPQAQTKISNEGFAKYCDTNLMTHELANSAEIVDFAKHHAAVVAQYRTLNPYRLGWKLLLDIEDRWNRGAFGTEYDLCDDLKEREAWDTHAGCGKEKVFEVVKYKNDVGLIQEFLTFDFALKNQLYTYRYQESDDTYYIASRKFEEIKKKLLFRLTNMGQPIIRVVDGNYRNQGELYLLHQHEDEYMLDIAWARETLKALEHLWGRPVHLETIEITKTGKRMIRMCCKNEGITTDAVYTGYVPGVPPFVMDG